MEDVIHKRYLAEPLSGSMGKGSDILRTYYSSFDEWGRLVRDPYHRLEFDTTIHFLKKHLPKRGLVLDAGGGPGRYTIELARQGYEIVLLDLSPDLLNIARREVTRAGVQNRVRTIVEGSIDDLSEFASESFDAVLCLGAPLNHLTSGKRREKAVDELIRVAKRRAPVAISVISRFVAIAQGAAVALVEAPKELDDRWKVYRRVLRTGDYDGKLGFAPCHFFLPVELEELLRRHGLKVIDEVGLQGIGAHYRYELMHLPAKGSKAWGAYERAHWDSCTHPASVATSEHFLMIGRKT